MISFPWRATLARAVRAHAAHAGLLVILFGASAAVSGQTPGTGQDHAGHTMPMEAGGISDTREGSGTSWLPDETPMHAVHRQADGWMIMGHGAAFLQYLRESGSRGSSQTGSVNWLMGMARRPVGTGRLTLRGMVSAEPWTIRGCGYPNLLATGESCDGEAIHDRQHPHDLFMELAVSYDRPLAGATRLQFYGGPVGEPALGPVAFMHRASADTNPIAPMTHHWLDSTHITFGVVTAGVYRTRWKVEGSIFNGREPNQTRTNFDFAAMDSFSGRAWWLPTSHWAIQVSAGRLNEAEPGHEGTPSTDISRVTSSVTYHRTTLENLVWANTVAWGRNAARGEPATNAVLFESSLNVRERHAWYGRFEWAQKSGHDLDVGEDGIYRVAKIQGGYTRYLPAWRGWTPGIGASVSGGFVPQSLEPIYGGRGNAGFGVYLTLRPGAQQ